MDESTFRDYMARAKQMGDEYGAGYQRGLRRHHHGDNFGTQAEHEQWLAITGHRQAMGDGYRDGFAGLPPSRRPGRPTTIAARRRSIMIDDERADYATEIGGGNLSEGIRRAIDIARDSGEAVSRVQAVLGAE